MGLLIGAINPKQKKYPIACYLELICDGRHNGFFDSIPKQRFEKGDFVKDYSAAMRAGWKEIHRERRMFLCPGCSGKSR